MTRLTDRPARHIVMAAIRSEAARADVDEQLVINPGYRAPVVVEARRRAIRAILAETGCSAGGLAAVWGLNGRTIAEASGTLGTKPQRVAKPPPNKGWFGAYDPQTTMRLSWAHGDAKAVQIIAGKDPRTQADIAKWRAL